MDEGVDLSKFKLCPTVRTVDGWFVQKIHHSVVPHYDYKAACKGLSQQGIQRELEVNWNATTGKLVYPDFLYDAHVASQPIGWNGEMLYCGWDLAHLGTPAFIPSFVNSFGQWCILPGVSPLEDETVGVYEMGEMVADYLNRTFCLPHELKLRDLPTIHFGDPQGNARPPRTKATSNKVELRSAFEIIRRGVELPAGRDGSGEEQFLKKPGFGWRIQGGAVSNHERQTAVNARLMSMINGLPALVVCPTATVIVEGFNGNYKYPQRADGRYDDEPEKNYWSHSMNAVEYMATRLFVAPEADEDQERPRRVVRSRAAGRNR
jgi:hypothetical protein